MRQPEPMTRADVQSGIIRKHEGGRLVAAGFSWHEPRHGLYKRAHGLTLLLLGVGWLPFVLLVVQGPSPAIWAAVALVPLAFLYRLRLRGRYLDIRKTLIWRIDGGTDAQENDTPPGRVPRISDAGTSHADIVNIEARPVQNRAGGQALLGDWPIYQVDLIFSDGLRSSASWGLFSMDDARVIAHQLNKALQEIREAQSA